MFTPSEDDRKLILEELKKQIPQFGPILKLFISIEDKIYALLKSHPRRQYIAICGEVIRCLKANNIQDLKVFLDKVYRNFTEKKDPAIDIEKSATQASFNHSMNTVVSQITPDVRFTSSANQLDTQTVKPNLINMQHMQNSSLTQAFTENSQNGINSNVFAIATAAPPPPPPQVDQVFSASDLTAQEKVVLFTKLQELKIYIEPLKKCLMSSELTESQQRKYSTALRIITNPFILNRNPLPMIYKVEQVLKIFNLNLIENNPIPPQVNITQASIASNIPTPAFDSLIHSSTTAKSIPQNSQGNNLSSISTPSSLAVTTAVNDTQNAPPNYAEKKMVSKQAVCSIFPFAITTELGIKFPTQNSTDVDIFAEESYSQKNIIAREIQDYIPFVKFSTFQQTSSSPTEDTKINCFPHNKENQGYGLLLSISPSYPREPCRFEPIFLDNLAIPEEHCISYERFLSACSSFKPSKIRDVVAWWLKTM